MLGVIIVGGFNLISGESCGILPNNLGLHSCSVMNKLIICAFCQRNFQTKGANYQHHDCICVCRLEATLNKCQLSLAILLYTHAPIKTEQTGETSMQSKYLRG